MFVPFPCAGRQRFFLALEPASGSARLAHGLACRRSIVATDAITSLAMHVIGGIEGSRPSIGIRNGRALVKPRSKLGKAVCKIRFQVKLRDGNVPVASR